MKKEIKGKGRTQGKGSNRRPESLKAIQRNWGQIKWGNDWCAWCGKFGNHTSGNCKSLKKSTQEVEQSKNKL